MRIYSYILGLISLIGIPSCSEHDKNFNINAKPIEVYLDNQNVRSQPFLKIKHEAFLRDFLFYGTFIPTLNGPSGFSLKGRVIKFQALADRVVMLESLSGHTIAEHSDSLILLAEFPIIEKDNDGIVIDFARGMNSAFVMRNVHSQGLSDKDNANTEQFRSVSLSASFVKNIESDGDVLVINQIAQWRNQKSELISAEFRYFLREYLPSPEFQKMYFGKNRFVQYFSTPPLVYPPTTSPVAFITKWDISRPIVFYISANTPEPYKNAVKDGLIFWNHIFGKNIIEVRDLDPKKSAPDAHLNILQWVTWDNEASAYADMIVDHLTGEVLQAQIYVRSGWVIQSIKKLRDQLEQLLLTNETPLEKSNEEVTAPMPSMFTIDKHCQKTLGDFSEVADLAHTLTKNEISNETLTILTGDILRAVIAHEMGHVLGLRHNLAGSTMGTISLEERDAMLKTYLSSGQLNEKKEKFFSQSIMDVFSAADDAIVGAEIRELLAKEPVHNSKLSSIYGYDKQAIDYGYFNKPMKGDIAFCSDDDLAKYQDCRRWDLSSTPLLFAASRLNNMLNQVALLLGDTFISALDPNRKGGQMTIGDVPITSTAVLKIFDQTLKDLFIWFNAGARSVKHELDFNSFGPQNRERITKSRFESQRKELAGFDLPTLLFAYLPPFSGQNFEPAALALNFRTHLKKSIQDEKQLNEAYEIALHFFEQLIKDLNLLTMNVLATARFDDPEFQIPIEEALGKIAQKFIFSTKSTSKTPPEFLYDMATRETAALLLAPAIGIVADWSFDNLRKTIVDLEGIVRKFAPVRSNAIDLSSLPRDLRRWLLDQQKILQTLNRVKTLTRSISLPPKGPVAPPIN